MMSLAASESMPTPEDRLVNEVQLRSEQDCEILVEQWKVCVEMADRVSARRLDASKVFVTLQVGLLAVVPFVLEPGTPENIQRIVFLGMGVLGITICIIWTLNLLSYRQLNRLKFKVIHEIEQNLPFACFSREWDILRDQAGSASYLRLTKVERSIPIVLTIPYLVLLIYTLVLYP